jgi:endonuclease/exonuclease/phosphatase family metal-dependent hydrolase
MFWNLENFFDFVDGGTGESDTEFSATGPRRWTKKRFYRKCHAVAKTVLWAGMPDIVGMAEVENRFVLRQLVTKTALRKLDYETVHFDSPDPRGIDCALLYRASLLTLVSAKPCRVSAPGLHTRDILLAGFRTLDGDSLAVLVNHHPSKYGDGDTDWRREVAVARLRALGDSLAAAGWNRAIAVGDFNDVPENPLFRTLEPAFSLCRQAGGGQGGNRGSIRFNGEWQLIDLCFVSPALAGTASFSVLEPQFLTERDAAHSGDKPLRTFSGPRYIGGVSDHRPILVRIGPGPAGQPSLPATASPAAPYLGTACTQKLHSRTAALYRRKQIGRIKVKTKTACTRK